MGPKVGSLWTSCDLILNKPETFSFNKKCNVVFKWKLYNYDELPKKWNQNIIIKTQALKWESLQLCHTGNGARQWAIMWSRPPCLLPMVHKLDRGKVNYVGRLKQIKSHLWCSWTHTHTLTDIRTYMCVYIIVFFLKSMNEWMNLEMLP